MIKGRITLYILPKLTCVSSFYQNQDSDCTNDEYTSNTYADNQRQEDVCK